MKQNFQLSEILTINTPENRCALAFSVRLQQHLETNKKTLFITANNTDLVRTNLRYIKQYLPEFDRIHEKTDYIFAKENLPELLHTYGIKTFEKELLTLAEEEMYDFYYFHRVDLFFNNTITSDTEHTLEAFIEAIRYYDKKVLFAYNNQTVAGKQLDQFLEKRRDLSFDIILNDNGECDLTMKTHHRLLQKESAKICLISDQKDMRYLHNTILQGQPNIKFDLISLENLTHNQKILDEDTDLIIYNDSRKFLTKDMTAKFKEFSPYAQIFWITNRKSIRKSDLVESKINNIDMLFPKIFDIKEYVHYIEQVIQRAFYSRKLQTLSYINEGQNVNFTDFVKRLKELERKHILHSIIIVDKAQLHHDNPAAFIRKDDFVHIHRNDDQVFFVLLNILPLQAKQIIAERTKVSPNHILVMDKMALVKTMET